MGPDEIKISTRKNIMKTFPGFDHLVDLYDNKDEIIERLHSFSCYQRRLGAGHQLLI